MAGVHPMISAPARRRVAFIVASLVKNCRIKGLPHRTGCRSCFNPLGGLPTLKTISCSQLLKLGRRKPRRVLFCAILPERARRLTVEHHRREARQLDMKKAGLEHEPVAN